MPELFLHSKKLNSVFELLGDKENDISFSLGHVLSKSINLLQYVVKEITGRFYPPKSLENTSIRLQEYQTKKGFTDFELTLPGEFFIIIEAKRGWNLPDRRQLMKYASRKEFQESFQFRRIVTLSECSDYYAELYLPVNSMAGIEVRHISFSKVFSLSKLAFKSSSLYEKYLITELQNYLTKLIRMQQLDSNWVYVVSLGGGAPEGWKINWIDIVKKKHKYFHPVGNRWPVQPPNYIAFRFHGQLQSIHFIEEYEVSKNLSAQFPEAPKNMQDHDPHFIYRLGKGFGPNHVVKNGSRIIWSNRANCMLDTLLTYPTISDAFVESKRRFDIIQNT